MNGVVHFEIPAADPDKLSEFYSQLFGWQINKMDMGGGYTYYLASTVETGEDGMPKTPGAINGGIYARTSETERPINYIDVDDIDSFVSKAEGLGAKVLVPKQPIPGMGWSAQMVDPQGNAYGLYQNDPGAA
jgi:predicted enzyme related to lactoylglutathione lyase